uniref:Putative testis development protein nyd-sp29 n=1 Tax=Schistosoma mansoni TaxID=6183 RepID=A0A3Q0KMK2_SCHMA
MKSVNGKVTPVENTLRNKSARGSSKSRSGRKSGSSLGKPADKGGSRHSDAVDGSSLASIKESHKPLDIFIQNELMPNCTPIFLSKSSQKIFNIVTDEQITRESPIILLNKSDILKDLQLRAAVSDFSVQKVAIKNYPGSDILLIYDADYKFGQNFVIVLSEETKSLILNPVKQAVDGQSEHDSNGDMNDSINDDEDKIEEYKESSDLCFLFKSKSEHGWIELGSENEITEMNTFETRSKVYTIFQRPRKEFGSVLQLQDENATQKGFSEQILSREDESFNIPIMELDKSTTNCEIICDKGVNTNWRYPKNAFTQYVPRMYTSDELKHYYHENNDALRKISKLYPLFEQSLLENEMYNFLSNDYENLPIGDETYDTRSDNTFKEFLSFTDLKYSKNKAITMIQWHPNIKGIIATSISERIIYDQRIDQASRILLQPTHIILWSFNDPLKPQLLLNAPDDIICFQFNPTNSNYIAGGCVNGQVVLWDIEKHIDDLTNVKSRLKQNNQMPLFVFDENELNKISTSYYSALSNIESSHGLPITDLKWIPDHLEINRLGYCFENHTQKCVQLMTCGLNGEILLWDIRPEKTPLAINKTSDSLKPPINVPLTFSALDLKWKPLLRIHLYTNDPVNDHAPIKFCIREMQGDRSLLTSNTKDSSINTTDNSSKLLPLPNADTHIYAGTEDGAIIYVDWIPHKDQDTGKMQTPKPEFCSSRHDGPISHLCRSPFDSSLVLAIGGWIWTMWKEGVTSGPIIESGRANKPLTGGSWSPTRPSVFYTCRVDGSIEVWDLLDKTYEPTMIQSISANSLTAISIWDSPKRQFIATGDIQGVLQLFIVPRRLQTPLPSELKKFNEYIEREVKRKEFVSMRWNLREQEKIEQEAENKRKAGLAPAVMLSDEEIIQKEKLEYEKYLSEEHAFLRSLGLVEEED